MFDAAGQFDPPTNVGTLTPSMRRKMAARSRQLMAENAVCGVRWSGCIYGCSGYAKANREIMFRLSNPLRVSIKPGDDEGNRDVTEKHHIKRTEAFYDAPVPEKSPYVHLFGPRKESARGPRVIYTMMETLRTHPDFIGLMNANYDECWAPTAWNVKTFVESGMKIPGRVMPLGVDPIVYHPGPKGLLPECNLITTDRAGACETPSGFLFIYVMCPSYRKGPDLLLSAFEEAFADDDEAGLVLATTHSHLTKTELEYAHPKKKSRVWLLTGAQTEWGLANIYRACDAYVCTSRGEGWNLPMTEAAACDLPVIAPRHTAHPDVLGVHGCYLFDAEGEEKWPDGGGVSPYYVGMSFPKYGERSKAQLVDILRDVKANHAQSKMVGKSYGMYVRASLTWDAAAAKVAERLIEMQS